VGSDGILQTYSTGRGRIILRGLAHIEEMAGNRHRIVITEIPFQLNKSSLIERIAELAREGKLDDISDLRDESDRRGMSIIIELRRGAQPKKVLNQLYKFTPLQSTFGAQLLALVDNEPRTLTLKRALQIFVEHRQEVITRRSQFELQKARERAHILAGLLIALDHLDEVINLIRNSADVESARQRLMERFGLSERQANAILDMQLRRLAALERRKIEDEHRQTLELIAYLEDLLANPRKILDVIKQELLDLSQRYNDKRRTHLTFEANQELSQEDLVPDEAVLVSITQRGYVKRSSVKSFRAQARGGRGVTGHATKEEDEVLFLFPARTLDTILFFSDRGKVYSEKAYQIPDAERTGRGVPIVNILSLEAGEKVTAAVSVRQFDPSHYCLLATRKGRIKRVALNELASVRPSGLIIMGLESGDEMGWARLTDGKREVILVTEQGKALRISENVVRPMGRTASGVTAIRLESKDNVASLEVVEPDGTLLLVTSKGFGKRVQLSEYPLKGRATGGVQTTDKKALAKLGVLSAARVVQEADEVNLMTAGGVVLRVKVGDIPIKARATQGIRLMSVGANDNLVTLARVSARDVKGSAEASEPAS
jgi:DNA gyrase subunit A